MERRFYFMGTIGYRIKVAEYVVRKHTDQKPAFAGWIPYVLTKRALKVDDNIGEFTSVKDRPSDGHEQQQNLHQRRAQCFLVIDLIAEVLYELPIMVF
jgi:hypothetical protein